MRTLEERLRELMEAEENSFDSYVEKIDSRCQGHSSEKSFAENTAEKIRDYFSALHREESSDDSRSVVIGRKIDGALLTGLKKTTEYLEALNEEEFPDDSKAVIVGRKLCSGLDKGLEVSDKVMKSDGFKFVELAVGLFFGR